MLNDPPHILFRKPSVADARTIFSLISASPPLDINSLYCYMIICLHFSNTSVVAESPQGICGFISAYIRPDRDDTLFVWQVVVNPENRGQGIAGRMLENILKRQYPNPVQFLETTVNPSNASSAALFESLAQRLQAACVKNVLFSRQDFGDSDHEEEILYRIGPFVA